MRYLLLVALAVAGCGNDDPPKTIVDAATMVANDLASPVTDASQIMPSDLSVASCVRPKPLTYLETTSFSYIQIGVGSTPIYSTSVSPVNVDGVGRITRPKTMLVSAGSYHCEFTDADIDAACTAPCCPGQPGSPIVHMDSEGWTTWQTGLCTFAISSASYLATITAIETRKTR